jgi:hypothetical protein
MNVHRKLLKKMNPPSDPNFGAALEDFKRGGWIVSILGGAGMLARMLLEDEQHPIRFWVAKILAGVIVGVICYFALWGTDISGLYKSIIMSTAGAGAPELLRLIKAKYNNLAKNEEIKTTKKKRRRKA